MVVEACPVDDDCSRAEGSIAVAEVPPSFDVEVGLRPSPFEPEPLESVVELAPVSFDAELGPETVPEASAPDAPVVDAVTCDCEAAVAVSELLAVSLDPLPSDAWTGCWSPGEAPDPPPPEIVAVGPLLPLAAGSLLAVVLEPLSPPAN